MMPSHDGSAALVVGGGGESRGQVTRALPPAGPVKRGPRLRLREPTSQPGTPRPWSAGLERVCVIRYQGWGVDMVVVAEGGGAPEVVFPVERGPGLMSPGTAAN